MQWISIFTQRVVQCLDHLYNISIDPLVVQITPTRKDQSGDLTLVVFPLTKWTRKSPEQTALEIGQWLKDHSPEISAFDVVKGFLNLHLDNSVGDHVIQSILLDPHYGRPSIAKKKIVLEYCGPNTNKPLHLGHVRNMLLGYSLAEILKFAGHEVVRVNMYNDRGIAICKSMVAWQRSGLNETPENTGMKGDHLIGKYYVLYDQWFRQEKEVLLGEGMDEETAAHQAPIAQAARNMLLKWEAGDPEVMALWKTMNHWVYVGFEQTYQAMGIAFDQAYYESETWTIGRQMVLEGLEKGIFFKKSDGSIWVNLEAEGLDEKVLLRADGTAVYLTQDLGTALRRYEDHHMDTSIYVVANEQDYHFKVLQLTLQKLGLPFADGIFHLSYGMVDLPGGRMKSREGNVVDADDLMSEMIQTAEKATVALGKLEGLSPEEAHKLYRMLGLGALKYFILRVDPKKKMIFNPEESIELQGQTGPFIQYTHARICSLLKKSALTPSSEGHENGIDADTKPLWLLLLQFPEVIQEAAQKYDPGLLAHFLYHLAKEYNRFYAEAPILKASEPFRTQRLQLSESVAIILQRGLALLGIEAPEKM